MTPEQRSEAAREAVRVRWANLTPEQRSALASKAAKARWAKVKKRPKEIVPRVDRPRQRPARAAKKSKGS